jgi:hypothetical protein
MICTGKEETAKITKVITETIPIMTKEIFKILGMKPYGKHKKQYQAFNLNTFSNIYHRIYTELNRYEED